MLHFDANVEGLCFLTINCNLNGITVVFIWTVAFCVKPLFSM